MSIDNLYTQARQGDKSNPGKKRQRITHHPMPQDDPDEAHGYADHNDPGLNVTAEQTSQTDIDQHQCHCKTEADGAQGLGCLPSAAR